MNQAMVNCVRKDKNLFEHFDTPGYAVSPLLPYINPKRTVREPTDATGKSQIAKVLREHGCKVVSTSQNKLDFLKTKPTFHYDCIVTNPPYSVKNDFIARCVELYEWNRKPRALLLPLSALEGVERGKIFRAMGIDFRLLIFDRRVEFTGGSVWFNTSWFCCGLLPNQLIFAELEKRAA
jgi:hypothetical protein